MDRDLESIQEARNLLQAAHEAWLKFENFTEEQVERALLEILKATFPCLAQRAGIAISIRERSIGGVTTDLRNINLLIL